MFSACIVIALLRNQTLITRDFEIMGGWPTVSSILTLLYSSRDDTQGGPINSISLYWAGNSYSLLEFVDSRFHSTTGVQSSELPNNPAIASTYSLAPSIWPSVAPSRQQTHYRCLAQIDFISNPLSFHQRTACTATTNSASMHPFSILTLGIFVAGYITARWDLVTRLYELAIFAWENGVVVSCQSPSSRRKRYMYI